eukprot:6464435-Amphidinium_carterae.1
MDHHSNNIIKQWHQQHQKHGIHVVSAGRSLGAALLDNSATAAAAATAATNHQQHPSPNTPTMRHTVYSCWKQ